MAAVFGTPVDEEEPRMKRYLLAIQPVNPNFSASYGNYLTLGCARKSQANLPQLAPFKAVLLEQMNSLISTIRGLQTRTANYYLKTKNRSFVFTHSVDKCSCMTVLTKQMRETLWGLHMEGITMPTPRDRAWCTLMDESSENLYK